MRADDGWTELPKGFKPGDEHVVETEEQERAAAENMADDDDESQTVITLLTMNSLQAGNLMRAFEASTFPADVKVTFYVGYDDGTATKYDLTPALKAIGIDMVPKRMEAPNIKVL